MNPAQPQASVGVPNAASGGQAQSTMYRPEMMRTIRFLTEDERGKYEKGLTLLWRQHDASPQGSPENLEARRKIMDFGRMLITKVQQRRQIQLQQAQQVCFGDLGSHPTLFSLVTASHVSGDRTHPP